LWNEILGQKAVVVVSPRGRAAISDRLYEQIPERGIKHLTAIKRVGPRPVGYESVTSRLRKSVTRAR
jgi:hypothetical protein